MEEGTIGGSAVPPREDEGDEFAIASGGEVDGRVSDVGDFLRGEVPAGDDLESGGGVGFFRKLRFVSAHGLEEVRGEEGFYNIDGVWVRFVGEDGHGDAGGVEFFEELENAGVGVCAFLPVGAVVFLEVGEDFGEKVLLVGEKSSFNEGFDAVADEGLDFFFRVGGV